MIPSPPFHGINGRLRRHITNVGTEYANRVLSAKRKEQLSWDAYINSLVEDGQVSVDELYSAFQEYRNNPNQFSWLRDFDDRVLDKADDVFFALNKRNPKEHDMRYYHKICKNLVRNWHAYDRDLKRLNYDYELRLRTAQSHVGTPARKPVRLKTIYTRDFRSEWKFIPVLIVYLAMCAPIAYFTPKLLPAQFHILPMLGMLLLFFTVGVPIAVRLMRKKRYKCPSCGSTFDTIPIERRCFNCDVEFYDK